jgi:hypothetical protein
MPPPIKTESSKRPVYVRELIGQVLEIRRTGIGANGQLVTFNKKRKQRSSQIQRHHRKAVVEESGEFDEIINGLKSLGLDPTASQVADLIEEHYPSGIADVDVGEAITKFLNIIRLRE